MELNEVKQLIDKYYDAATSLEEEQALRTYLASYSGDDVALLSAKAMFGVFSATRNEQRALDVKPRRPKFMLNLRRVAAIAAACVVVIIVLLGTNRPSEQEPMLVCHINGVMVSDELVAQAEASKILSSVFEDVDNAVAEINRITGYSSRR